MKLYYQIQIWLGIVFVFVSRLRWTNKDKHRIHRGKNNRFKRCDCIFLKDAVRAKALVMRKSMVKAS